jgi:uncharacterized membrane protein YkvA (DUF1232 family)
MWYRLKTWARKMKRETLALYLASRDPRVPWYAKTMAMATAAYAFSPIDFIPDFIPVLGYVDELFVLPLMIYLTVQLVPSDLMVEFRAKADHQLKTARPRSMTGAVVIVLIWLSIAAMIVYWLTQ